MKADHSNVSERIGWAIAGVLDDFGMDGREAARIGNRFTDFLHDLTPAGNADGIFYPTSESDRQISMTPLPGPARRGGKAIIDGMEEAIETAARNFARPKNTVRPPEPESLPEGSNPSFANHSWESAPGKTTGHLQGFDQLPYDARQAYHERAKKIFLTDDGRSRIALSSGQPVKPSFDNVGVYKGEINPGTQDRVGVVIASDGKVTPRSAARMDETGAIHGSVGGQDAMGWNHFAEGASFDDATAIRFDLGRPMSVSDVRRYGPHIEAVFGDSAGMLPDENGFRIAQFWKQEGSPTVAEFVEQLRKNDPALLAAPLVPGVHSGNLYKNNWSGTGRSSADYGRLLMASESPDIGKRFDSVAPQIAERLLTLDAETAAKYGLKTGEEIELFHRTLAEKGWEGFKTLIKDGRGAAALIPLVLGWAGLQPPPEDAN